MTDETLHGCSASLAGDPVGHRLRTAPMAAVAAVEGSDLDRYGAPLGAGRHRRAAAVRDRSRGDRPVRDADGRQTLEEMQVTTNELPGLAGSTFFFDAVAAAKARSALPASDPGPAVGTARLPSSH